MTKQALINTGVITEIEDYSLLGLEAAVTRNKFNLQAEYMKSFVQHQTQDVEFEGWYLQSSYFLTNDRRPYSKGKYGVVKPKSVIGNKGYGAWEVAARISQLDLSDQDIFGGRQQNLTVGLNLYATPEIRFSAEYIHVLDISHLELEDTTSTPSLAQLRVEWVF